MRARTVLLALLACLGLQAGLKAQPAIPEARFRVVYKATNEPVHWLAVQIYCQRKLTWREQRRIGWSDMEATVYHAFSFHATQDGWVTLPAVQAPGTTDYIIEIRAPGCSFLTYPCKGGLGPPFYDDNLPKFLKLPPEKRVLYAEYTNDANWIPTQQRTYEGISYTLDALEIYLREWPKLDCGLAGGCTPSYNMYKEGAPYHKKRYFDRVYTWVDFRSRDFGNYEESASGAPSEEAKAGILAKAQELRTRFKDIVCKDLLEKKRLWDSHQLSPAILNNPSRNRQWYADYLQQWTKREEEEAREGKRGFEPPCRLLDDPFIKEMNCEALREFYPKAPGAEQSTPPQAPTEQQTQPPKAPQPSLAPKEPEEGGKK